MANKAEEVREAAPAKKVEAREAFNAYLRKGFNNLSAEERSIMGELRGTNTQITTNDGLGGFLVPENWAAAVSATELFKSDIEKVATIISTSNGQPFNLPANNDTSVAAAILGEGTAESVSDMTFTNVKFEPYTYSSKIVKVSRQLVSDNAFDLGSFVAGQLANRLNRGINGHLTTGTGSSQPSGIVTGSSLGKTAASASAVTIAEILDLMYSVDASYRNSAGAAFMMNSATLAAVRKLGFGSSNDFPVFVPAMEVGGVDLLFGKPVYVNEDMAGIATGNKSIIFGDMKQYYIHQAGGVQLLRLEERYADELSVGYIAYKRVDGNVVQDSAIKHLVQA
jgi:HK97 family phage major capsid protein